MQAALDGIRGAEPAATPRTGRRASSCSTAGGCGTRPRAAGWAGSGSAASCTSSTGCSAAPRTRPTPRCRPTRPTLPRIRFVITLDADTQSAARGGPRGWSAPWPTRSTGPRFDPAHGRRVVAGLRHPPAARQLPHAGGRPRRCSPGCSPARPASTRTRRPSPTSTRTCSASGTLHRQGHLRRRRLRGGRRPHLPREPHPQPRPDRGQLRPLRPGHRRRAARRLPGRATPPTPAASTAGSAATGRLLPWLVSQCAGDAERRAARRPQSRLPGCWSAGSLRQPPPQPGAAGAGAAARARLDGAARLRLAVDRRSCAGRAGLLPLLLHAAAASLRAGRSAAALAWPQLPAPGSRSTAGQVAAGGRFLPTRRCSCSTPSRDARPPVRHAAGTCWSGRRRRRPSARLGNGLAHFVRIDVAGRRVLARARRRAGRLARPEALPAAAPLLAAWLLRRWSPAGSASRAAAAPSCRCSEAERPPAAPRGPQDLGLLRGVRRRRGPLAAAGQLPGRAQGRVAHRTSPTNIGLLLLSTLAAHDLGYLACARLLDAAREHLRHARPAGALPRPLPQLVRHADAAAAAPGLRLDRGQRQPARLPADAEAGAAGEDGRAVPRPRLLDGCATRWSWSASSWRRPQSPPIAIAAEMLRTKLARCCNSLLATAPDDLAGWRSCSARSWRRRRGWWTRSRRWATATARPGAAAPDSSGWSRRPGPARGVAALAPWLQHLPKQRCRRAGRGELAGEPARDAVPPRADWPQCDALACRSSRPGRAGPPPWTAGGRRRPPDQPAPPTLLQRLRTWPPRRGLAGDMDFRFLYNRHRHLFAIGYNLPLGAPRQRPLRPAGLRGVPDQLPGRRPRRRAAQALVPARPPVHRAPAARSAWSPGAAPCSST